MLKRLSSLVLFAALAWAPVAKADSVTFTLQDPAQAGAPGTIFTYTGTIAAPSSNAADVYLNDDLSNVSGTLLLDDTAFFTNFPLFLAPGQSVTDVLFTLSSDASSAEGLNTGSFELLGGADEFASGDLGTVTFSAQVTPEPSSLLLLGTGLVGGIAALRKRRVYGQPS